MDESTFETFEEELCPSGQQELPVKPVRQLHRPDPQPLRKMREEPPRPGQREGARKASLHGAISQQSSTRIEAPREWITLNRCLVLAVIMVLIGSSFQRLCEVLEGFGQKAETQSPPGVQSVDLRHISLELDGQLEQIESSLWDNWFWNLILDDDTTEDEEESEEEEEEEEEESSRREAEETGAQEGLGGYRHRKSSKKNFLIQRKEKMRGRSEKTARWEKNEELSELTREHKVREKKVRLQRSEEDEDLGEDEEESPKGKRQSAEAERWQKRKKQLLQVKKVPIRGHRHNL